MGRPKSNNVQINISIPMEWKKELESQFPGMPVYMAPLSLSVACHIGQGALAVAASKKVEVE